MPFISETASAIKSRFGFHSRSTSSDSAPSFFTSPDLSLKSVSRDNHPGQSLAATSAVRSIGDWDDNAAAAATASSHSFEFSDDPSFWKDHNVQVIIRIRPLSRSEISVQGYNKCIRQESCQTITWTGHPESRFTFDIVADENVSQERLFKAAGVPMVDNCMGGYNSCMFAYGQTGSGKTHTMLGDIEESTQRHSVNSGMTPRVFEYLFSTIQKEKIVRKDEKIRFNCKCSFLEIYNEQILDLLDPSSSNLQIREDNKKGVYVENLKEIEVTSARDVIQQLIQGAANRKVAATNMNRASSRSHSVFTCIIESKWESQGVTHHRFARLNLVDLAGSERQKSSGAEGERLKEATNINKSLSTLGLVIMNLVSISNGKSLHVPYRDSKLTFLLQDSLGGNSKTIIIANISPSSCCSLETLSTLKFAQRAKFIKNNVCDLCTSFFNVSLVTSDRVSHSRLQAIVNEDASGDVIAMRMEIQQLKKEVSRLRGIAHGGAESLVNDSPTVSFPGSPGSIKWEGLHESFSPLISDKRMSQKKDYELALVGAFRREKEKDISLQALVAENQAALRLAKQREDEIQGLKMRLRFREAGIKRLEAVASGKISAETHLLKEKEECLKEIEVLRTQLLEALDWKLMHESDSSAVQANSVAVTEACSDGDLLISSKEPGSPWRTSVNEENEFLRMQAIHNQAEMETLRKQLEFSLEEKEKLERHVSDLVKQLEEQTCPISAKEETQEFQLSTNVPTINFDDQVELKTMVDAIAVASQREAEAHQTAIGLSKMHDELTLELEVLNKEKSEFNKLNDELQLKHKVLIEEKSNLIELYERKEMEMKREAENLELQLAEMHEENEKLLGLYEKAMQERDEFKRMISLCGQNRAEASGEIYCPEKLVEIDGGKQHITSVEPGLPALNGQDRRENSRFENLKSGENISRMDVHNGFSLYPGNSQANKETHISSQVEGLHSSEKTPGSAEAAFADMETEQLNLANIKVTEDLNLVRLKLEKAQEKLSDSANTITLFGSVEKAFAEVDKLSGDIVAMEDSIQAKQQQCGSLKHLCSEMQERKALVDNKLMALKYSLSSFSSSAAYFEQRAARSRARVTTSSTYLNQKKEQLVHLECCKREIEDALGKVQRSEAELRNNLALLKSKLEEENRRQENEKVLFAIDNIEKVDHPQRNWNLGGKATELLKSEEEKTKLQTELKLCRERLGVVKREFEDLTKKSWKIDSDLQTVQMEIQKSSRSVEEMELAHQAVLQEQEALLEIREKGKTEIESMILEYMQHVFEADLKEAEMRIVEEELQLELRRMDELRVLRAAAAEKKAQLLEHTKSKSCLFSEKMQEELKNVWSYLFEAKSLLV
ncbi:kinesin-like protein KIN-12E [Citrus sinensis]|uniref:Kinesin-like protein KIN-12E n=1 Tax=Citrus sinensis TaxID=2711 RepID=A0ACB8IQY5_CITSI|nr:kinesin-like protein KIN-12E [Citrus sinensis]